MPLSANTLIHFTNSKEILKRILEENFRVSYCKETVLLKDPEETIYHAPMVSFCDIPLSEIKDHISKYGNYGLGLTKDWGITKGLNPVLYVAKNSMLAGSYEDAFNHYIGDAELHELSAEQKSLIDALRYIKNYEGDLTRKGKTELNYRFSDEREWRFVPPLSAPCPMIVDAEGYLVHKKECDAYLEEIRLEFAPNDIKYIIINDDSEIREFIHHLRDAKGKKYSYDEVDRLSTRILTVEQIRCDM
ncbi:abortive infection system antitoxin AbiGi family protein [Geotalea sp. SG265]|uniref:abortive infection system antitoxin AbiGi family protein n=1 Tax=Geotalea sp. SG265 TaxID=2922867 RepID=UPI001FAEFDDC|nr:abortive infection system antitoxin AbiGi family protein [Geotalea sp. SG265]